MAEERRRCVKPCRRNARPGRKTCGDRTCTARAGHRARPDHVQPQMHRCAWKTCDAWVPRTEAHRTEADYRKVRYCDAHRHTAKGQRGRRVAMTKAEQKRPCERDGCRKHFASPDAKQKYCGRPCSVLARSGKKPTKTCQCGCGTRFERPSGITTKAWEARRFLNAEHRAQAPSHLKGGQKSKPTERSPLANGELGASRGGNRRAPKIVGARKPRVGGNAGTDRAKGEEPVRAVFPDAKKTPPRRFGQVPTIERVPRQTTRPSFGLTRRRSA